jgi:pyruvate,water dikinase
VRSSATAEDLPGASFAGQQESYLNIQGEQALLEAVQRCWASLWTARAIAYRARQGVDPNDVSLAVVVQTMVEAEAAGILFTANPLDGERNQIVINAAWGLGEAIVGGLVTPDTVVVDKSTQTISSRATAIKAIMTMRTATGVAEQPVPSAQQKQPVLDDRTALKLAFYGLQIEAHYGYPMDIEWALAGDNISILQARPITNLPPAPLRDVRWEPPIPGTVWMRRQVVEHMPEPLSPLFDELYVREGLAKSVDNLFEMIGGMDDIQISISDFLPLGFATTVNGYAYSVASYDFKLQSIPAIVQLYGKILRYGLPDFHGDVLPAYLTTVTRWKEVDLAATPDADLLRGIRELATAEAIYWFASDIPLAFTRITDTLLNFLLGSWLIRSALSQHPRPTSAAYLRGFPSKALEAQADLEAVARQIDAVPNLRAQVLAAPAERLAAILADHPDGQDASSHLQAYLDKYGHQIYNLDFAVPTQLEEPLPVLSSLKALVQNPDRDMHSQQSEMVKEREALVKRTVQALNPFSRQIFRLSLSWAQQFAPYREEILFYLGSGWPTLRRLAHELGRRLTQAGSLTTPDDVFYLESAELQSAIDARAQGEGDVQLAHLAHERRILRDARKRLTPPLAVPPEGRLKVGPFDLTGFSPQQSGADAGPILSGFAVSPGRVTAPASVIHSPADFAKMQPDTILVCRTTTPAWTPLFSQAKGLVTDIGGALAHGSIVAREYGIPAVMGTGVATARITAGMMLAVDGDAGTVTLVDEAGAAVAAPAAAPRATISGRKKALVFLAVGVVVGLVVWWKRRSPHPPKKSF